jgi:hypothetical protein
MLLNTTSPLRRENPKNCRINAAFSGIMTSPAGLN